VTFTDIQNAVADRLNLTSANALTRIGQSINEKYRELASSIGLQSTVRTTATANTVVGTSLLTFGPTPIGVEKIFSVFNAAYTPPMVLDEVTVDELRNQPLGTDPAEQYAIYNTGASSVTIQLSSKPATIYTMSADVETNIATLSGLMIPNFAEDYHAALIYGGMAVELEKMEKYEMAAKQEAKYQARLSDLRLFIAKSAYLAIYQGKSTSTNVLTNRV
jgi:hypothetical protein